MGSRLFKHLCLLVVFLGSTSAISEPLTHKQKTCLSCHSVDSRTAFRGPQLGGLPEDYIYQQLVHFKTGQRVGADEQNVMAAVSQSMSDAQMKNIAEWAADLETTVMFDPSSASDLPGFQVYETSCQACHSSFMGRLMTDSPKLDSLNLDYLISQLHRFRDGSDHFESPTKHQTKMVKTLKDLSDTDFANLKAFIKSAVPLR